VKVWQTDDGSQHYDGSGQHGHRWCIVLTSSGDGQLVASVSEDEIVTLWDATTGLRLGTLHGHDTIVKLVSFSSGSALCTSGRYVWNVHTRCLFSIPETKLMMRVASDSFSPDSNQLVSWVFVVRKFYTSYIVGCGDGRISCFHNGQ